MRRWSEQGSKSAIAFKEFTMKKIVICLIMGIVLIGCYSSDDYYDRTVRLQVRDVITFTNDKEYQVGDTLRFEVAFSRYLNEDGFSSPLDVFETTGAEAFSYGFDLYQYSDFSKRFEPIFLDSELVIGSKGEGSYYFGNGVVAELNETRDTYVSEVGVVLVESGTFQLDFDFLYFTSPFNENSVIVSIEYVRPSDGTLDLEFSVVE